MYAIIFIAVAGSTIMAWTLAVHAREPAADSARARRIRGIAKLAPLVGVIVTFFALLLVEPGYEYILFDVAVGVGLTIAPAPFVCRRAERKTAFLWTAWSLPFGVWTLYVTFSSVALSIVAELLVTAMGTLAALLAIVLPLTALITSDRVEIPEARASDN